MEFANARDLYEKGKVGDTTAIEGHIWIKTGDGIGDILMKDEQSPEQRAVTALSKILGENPEIVAARIEEAHANEIALSEVSRTYSFKDVNAAVADRGAWESMHLGNWSHPAKYQREEVEKMLRRGEISEARAEELLREVKPRDGEPCGHPGCLNHISHPCEGCGRIGGRRFNGPHVLTDKDGNTARCSGSPISCYWCAREKEPRF